jgi:hypothetical protein
MAIALDTSATAATNTGAYTYSYTITGSNCFLVVALFLDSSATISAVNWNTSEAMTLVGSAVVEATITLYLWYLQNPTSGTHNVSVTQSASANIAHLTASYTGCATTGQPDNTKSDSQSTQPTTVSLTTTADQCWFAGVTRDANEDTITINSGGTSRRFQGTHTCLFDSNGALSAGSNSVVIGHVNSGQVLKTFLVSFAPSGGITVDQEAGIWAAMVNNSSIIGRVDA